MTLGVADAVVVVVAVVAAVDVVIIVAIAHPECYLFESLNQYFRLVRSPYNRENCR